jgi:EAL domain-containing protein (putative c-di-GMP-specific phosphodiesterase class I)
MDPALAFEVAERIGRAHVLDALCRRAVLARAHELPPGVLLFLNVSPQSLDQDELAGDALVRAVRAAGLEPGSVVLEITERSAARLDRVVREAVRLRALGFKIALDDVGAGNAGLEMLRSLPVDFVKIDRAVIVASGKGGSARAVLHAVVSFAAEVGAFVIAEGIENEAMLAHVREPGHRPDVIRPAGVHGVQGYLLGRPSVSLPSLAEAA